MSDDTTKAAKALAKAEARLERASLAYGRVRDSLNDAKARYLVACGWERVWCWPPRDRLWKRGDRVYTTWGAVREQGQTEKRRSRRAKAKARRGETGASS